MQISARAFKALLFRRMRDAVAATEDNAEASIDARCRVIAAELLSQLLTQQESVGVAFWHDQLFDVMKERFIFHDVEEWVGISNDEIRASFVFLFLKLF
jgi:hypothetical protein